MVKKLAKKRPVKKRLIEKKIILGAVSLTMLILFVSLFIVVSPENTVGNAWRIATTQDFLNGIN